MRIIDDFAARSAFRLASAVLLAALCAALALGVLAAGAPAARAVAPALTLTATPAPAVAGHPVTVTAYVDVPGAALALSRRRATETEFTLVRSGVAGADGTVSWSLKPPCSTTYRVEFAGDAAWEPAAAEAWVAVRPRLTLEVPAAVYEGQTAVFRASVVPAHPGATLELQRLADGVWEVWQTLTLDAESRAVHRWQTDAQGSAVYRVVMAADADHARGVGARRRVTVQEPNPYNVPISAPRIVVVDKSKYKLFYCEYGRVVRVFDCVLGKPSTPTPLGRFRIYAKDFFPESSCYGPRRMRYQGLFAIHGTDEPWLLQRFPRNYSHGCTRLANADIRWLFERCRVGTRVWNVP